MKMDHVTQHMVSRLVSRLRIAWIMAHMQTNHGTYANESWHICKRIMALCKWGITHLQKNQVTQLMLHGLVKRLLAALVMAHMHTWVMAYMRKSHVTQHVLYGVATQLLAAWVVSHIQMSRDTCVFESWHTCQWVMSRNWCFLDVYTAPCSLIQMATHTRRHKAQVSVICVACDWVVLHVSEAFAHMSESCLFAHLYMCVGCVCVCVVCTCVVYVTVWCVCEYVTCGFVRGVCMCGWHVYGCMCVYSAYVSGCCVRGWMVCACICNVYVCGSCVYM